MLTQCIATLLMAHTLMCQQLPEPRFVDLGTFEVTAYAEDTITATGTKPTPMRTVAVDPRVIPYGTKLYIDDLDLYVVAEDCGSAVKGKTLDLYVSGTEADANRWGRTKHRVWTLKK